MSKYGIYLVYRFYDAAGSLLYVGTTRNFMQRMRHHARYKEWWPAVAKVEAQGFTTEADMLDAEKTQIKLFKPRYNIEQTRRLVWVATPRKVNSAA